MSDSGHFKTSRASPSDVGFQVKTGPLGPGSDHFARNVQVWGKSGHQMSADVRPGCSQFRKFATPL